MTTTADLQRTLTIPEGLGNLIEQEFDRMAIAAMDFIETFDSWQKLSPEDKRHYQYLKTEAIRAELLYGWKKNAGPQVYACYINSIERLVAFSRKTGLIEEGKARGKKAAGNLKDYMAVVMASGDTNKPAGHSSELVGL